MASDGKFTPLYIGETKERVDSYYMYLKTEWWSMRRRRFGKKFKCKCGLCAGVCIKPNLHHLSYKNLGRERDTDLVWLCRECHRIVHDIEDAGGYAPKLNRFPREERKAPKKKRRRKRKKKS